MIMLLEWIGRYMILRLIALSLELPEETLVEKYNFEGRGETSSVYPPLAFTSTVQLSLIVQ